MGAPHSFSTVDVASEQNVEAWAGKAVKEHGAPDLLINNAGVINRNAPLWEVPEEEFASVLGVNVGGTARILRHFLPPMLARASGVIANFSSTWGRTTSPEVAPYCASKWAVEGLTQALSQELPSGLAAVAVNPGIIHTEMLESCFGGGAAGYPSPEAWAKRAAPFLLNLSTKDNGRSVTVG